MAGKHRDICRCRGIFGRQPTALNSRPKGPDKMTLDLSDFQPKSMLHFPETTLLAC
jgi:hypothetical protein